MHARGPAVCIVSVTILASVLAGCLGPEQSASVSATQKRATLVTQQRWIDVERPVFSLAEIRAFQTASDDGTLLRGHVYLPNGTGPFATVLELSPYWNSASPYGESELNYKEVDGRRTMGLWHQPLLDAGFAVALINMRGTGESDGCFQFGGLPDAADAYAVIEALAKEPWSNGNVGMVGLSYPGWSQYLALHSNPPSLKAVVPSSGVIDVHSLVTRNGAALNTGFAVSPLWTAGTGFGVYAFARTSGPNPNPFVPDTGPSHVACPRYAPDFVDNAQIVWNGDRDAYWEERDYRDAIRESHVPIFISNGMTSGEGHILQFEGLWDMVPTPEKRMMLGQHGHAYPTGVREDWPSMQVAWLDRYLRGGPPLVETGLVEYQDDQKTWHVADAWPPAAETTTLLLSERTLVTNEPEPSTQTFQSANANPGTTDCNPVQAVYVSPPVKERVLLAGNFVVNLTITSTLPDGNLAAFLYHTPGSGECPDTQSREIRRALTDLRHPFPNAPGADFPVNTPTTVTVRSHPFASIVEPGERIVLAIGGESTELQGEFRKPVLTITTGPDVAGSITIPVVEGRLLFE